MKLSDSQRHQKRKLLLNILFGGAFFLVTFKLNAVAIAQVHSLHTIETDNESNNELLVQLRPHVQANRLSFDQAALEKIAAISEPETTHINKGDDIIEVIADKYGLATIDMWPLIVRANTRALRSLTKYESQPRELIAPRNIEAFVLPAGPKLQQRAVKVRATEKLSNVLQRELGSDAAEIVQFQCGVGNIQSNGNCDSVKAGTTTHVWSAPPITVKVADVSPNGEGTAANSLENLKKLSEELESEDGVARSIVNDSFELIDPEDGLASANSCGVDKHNYANWPFNERQVKDIILRNFRLLERLKLEDKRVRIVVADSGLDRNEASRNRIAFYRHKDLPFDEGIDVTGTSLSGDQFPLSDNGRNPDGKAYNHGIHVAGLIMASALGDANEIRKVTNNVRIYALKITNAGKRQIKTKWISEAAEWAERLGAHIVNLSIQSKQNENSLRFLEDRKNILFILAADQDTRSVNEHGLFPAIYGGYRNQHILSIAAHDVGNLLYKNTNFGSVENAPPEGSVDFAAPGVCIESYSAKGGTKKYTGTSQAAPLVSFVASQLYRLGYERPHELKFRLLSSVDIFGEYTEKLYAGGFLNFYKALLGLEDVVEYVDEGETKYALGAILDDKISVCGRNREISNLLKLAKWTEKDGSGQQSVIFRVVSKSTLADGPDKPSYYVRDLRRNCKQDNSPPIRIMLWDKSTLTLERTAVKDIVFTNSLYREKILEFIKAASEADLSEFHIEVKPKYPKKIEYEPTPHTLEEHVGQ
ncbi:MAG: S8 family serine peptidase [Pseudomonadota bacterium]